MHKSAFCILCICVQGRGEGTGKEGEIGEIEYELLLYGRPLTVSRNLDVFTYKHGRILVKIFLFSDLKFN